MKVTPSPLVASMSGTSAGAVAASWKGRQYVRKHVVPKNPDTAAQQSVREAFASCVTLWRSLVTPVKAWLDAYGTALRMSGYNVFMRGNRALEQAGSLLIPLPPNPHVPAPLAFAYDSEPDGTSIKVDWTDSENEDFPNLFLALRRTDRFEFEAVSLDTLDSAEAKTFTGLTPGKTYQIYAALYDPDSGAFGTVASVERTLTPA